MSRFNPQPLGIVSQISVASQDDLIGVILGLPQILFGISGLLQRLKLDGMNIRSFHLCTYTLKVLNSAR
jgi:hypothetical protein